MIPNRRMKSRFWKLEKNVREKKGPKKEEERNRQSRMTLLIFLSRLQIENYVMTAFSIRKKQTANNISHLRVAVVKFQYPSIYSWKYSSNVLTRAGFKFCFTNTFSLLFYFVYISNQFLFFLIWFVLYKLFLEFVLFIFFF